MRTTLPIVLALGTFIAVAGCTAVDDEQETVAARPQDSAAAGQSAVQPKPLPPPPPPPAAAPERVSASAPGGSGGQVSARPTDETSEALQVPEPPQVRRAPEGVAPAELVSSSGSGGSPSGADSSAAPPQASPGDSLGSQSLPQVRLSAGVALPQSLPGGTVMSFSVDYEFTVGAPGRSPYVCVIERGRGQPARQPVQLQPQGTLALFVPGWRPNEGPFQVHLETRDGRSISQAVELKGL